jgi:hypothetical protein
MHEEFIKDKYEMEKYLIYHNPDTAYFLNKTGSPYVPQMRGYKVNMAYSFYPSWISTFNINHWEDRTQLWSIYLYYKKGQ